VAHLTAWPVCLRCVCGCVRGGSATLIRRGAACGDDLSLGGVDGVMVARLVAACLDGC
jgi:hypothetical protein